MSGWVAGAIVVGSVVSSQSAKSAAKKAAGAQLSAAELGISEEQRQFDITQEQLAPFREAALPALEQQQALLGLTGQKEQQAAFQALQESPGQRFIRQRAQKGLLRGASALGGLGGGNIRTALQEQAAGFAQQDLANQFNRLSALTGAGQTAATSIGQFGQTAAGNISNLLQAGGQARASGILGQQQAQAQGIQQLSSLAGQFGGGGGGGFTTSPFATAPTAQSTLGGLSQFGGLG